MDGELETNQLSLRAGELLARASGLFTTDINLSTESKSSGSLAGEIEAMLLAANESAEPNTDTSTEVH